MSDELDELEKSWDESKYDPNIGLREMWDREEAYRRKKEEEDAKQREKERREEEARERERRRREEEEHIRKMNEDYQRQKSSSSSTPYDPFSRSSGTSSDTIAPHSDSNEPVAHGPLTCGDFVGSIFGFFIAGCVGLAPILFLIFFKKIINAFSWMFSHWFCILSGLAGFCIIAFFIIYVAVFLATAGKEIPKKNRKSLLGLYLLGGVIYFLVCRKSVQDGTNVFLAIFRELPVLFYFPAGVGLFLILFSAIKDKTLWTFKSLKELFSFPVAVLAVWFILFLLVILFKDVEWAVNETKTALLFYRDIFATIVEWFLKPMAERLREMY